MNRKKIRSAWTYSHDAKVRIAELGNNEITEFLAEVPIADRKVAYGYIKTISGFRPDTEPEFKEKGKRLVSALSQVPDLNSKLYASEWAAFSIAWLSWGKHKFKVQIPEPTSESDIDESFATASLLRKLVPVDNLTVCREDVERWLLFSGFPLTDQAAPDLSWIPTRTVLEQARKAVELPAEIESLKEQLKSHESEIVDLRDSMRDIHAETATLQRKLVSSLDQVAEAKSVFLALKSAHASADSQNSERVQASEERVRKLERELSAVKEDLVSRFDGFTERADFLMLRLEANQEAALDMQEAIASLQAHAARQTAFSTGDVRVPVSMMATRLPVIQYKSHELVTGLSDLTVTSFNDAGTALSVLTKNLAAVGIRKDDSALVAATVLTGVVAGQLVQFKGSFAELVVEAVAAALSENQALFWQIPLGLQDSSETDFILAQLSKDKEVAGCVAIVGANRSAFEIYGDKLAHAIGKQQLGIRSPFSDIPLLATYISGVGVLPPGPELCCLGPVIDVDALIWGRANKYATFTTGSLDSTCWADLVEPAKMDDDIEPIIRSLPKLSFTTRLWERVARNALLILRRLDNISGVEHPENFMAHWLLPWARANGMADKPLRDLLTEMDSSWLDEKVIENSLVQSSGAAV